MSIVDSRTETIGLHDLVAFETDVWSVRAGTHGTIVDVYPDRDTYTVEVSDDDGRMLALVPAHRKELRVLEHASRY